MQSVAVTLIDRTSQRHTSQDGRFIADRPRETAFCDHTIRSDELLVVEDAHGDARFLDFRSVTSGQIGCSAGHPLRAPGGQEVGALCLTDVTGNLGGHAVAGAILEGEVVVHVTAPRPRMAWCPRERASRGTVAADP